MKHLKSKLAAGVLSVGIVASVGTAMANTDAGEQFRNWYNAQFTASADRVNEALLDHSYIKEDEWIASNAEFSAAAVQDVADKGTEVTNNANSAINSAKDDYIAAINAAKGQIATDIAGDYDDEITRQNGLTDQFVEDAGDYYLGVMQDEVNAQGTASETSLNTSVTGTKAAAISALQAAIEQAKTELEALIAAEETAAISETTTHLDNAIATKKADIERLVSELEETIKGDLKDAADLLQASAEGELDALVDGIFVEPVEAPAAP